MCVKHDSYAVSIENTPKDTEAWKSLKCNKCRNVNSMNSNLQNIQSKKVGGAFLYMWYVNDSDIQYLSY
jgi:uridine kinase